MQETILISLPVNQLQTLIIDSVNACLDVREKFNPAPQKDFWLNLKDLCEYLPSKPRPATVYAWVADSKIPFHKPGGKNLSFLKSEIDDWIKGTRVKTSSEIKQQAKAYINKK